jgi:uncharacterized MAPEG superfamily protein
VTTDLYALVMVGLLALLLAFLPGASRIQRGGMSWGLGNREAIPADEPPWVGRAVRAHANLLENLPLFTILVLAAQLSHEADSITANASLAFMAARIGHAAVYIAGITVLRTALFYAGLLAELVILWRIAT